MAKTKNATNVPAVIEKQENSLVLTQEKPDYLTGTEKSGLEGLNKDDYNIPQLKLIHPISPEFQQYPSIAVPGQYFHTALVKSLGDRVPCVITVARKRVILWRPKNDQGGGILAVSNDSVNWNRGGNTEFTVNLKGVKQPVKWHTRENVRASGLLEFGSSNPEIEDSQPAASLYYEYIVHLPTFTGASPVVQRFHKTGVKAAKDLNAYFLLKRQQGVPIYACAIEWTVGSKPGPEGNYFVPMFEPKGHIDKAMFDITSRMHKDYADIELNIEQDNETADDIKNVDSIPF